MSCVLVMSRTSLGFCQVVSNKDWEIHFEEYILRNVFWEIYFKKLFDTFWYILKNTFWENTLLGFSQVVSNKHWVPDLELNGEYRPSKKRRDLGDHNEKYNEEKVQNFLEEIWESYLANEKYRGESTMWENWSENSKAACISATRLPIEHVVMLSCCLVASKPLRIPSNLISWWSRLKRHRVCLPMNWGDSSKNTSWTSRLAKYNRGKNIRLARYTDLEEGVYEVGRTWRGWGWPPHAQARHTCCCQGAAAFPTAK